MRTDSIALDCDVLVGAWPPRAELDFSPATVEGRLTRAGVERGLVCSGRGAWFDDRAGNEETATLAGPRWLPAGTVNLRNALDAEAELERLAGSGTRYLRLFGPVQGCEPHFPGYRHLVRRALDLGLVLLVEGDVRQIWTAFAGRGASVVFLDVHAYHLADFVVCAREEPGFVSSTRLLNAPDSIERVAGEVGAHHLAYGSRTPLHDTSPALLRFRRARLTDEEWRTASGAALLRTGGA